MYYLNLIFEDKRLCAVFVLVWLAIVLGAFSHAGIMNTQFMSFGPSAETYFMGIQLYNWPRWCMVAVFTFVSTAVNDFVGDALVPFITNAIQDHKTVYLPYNKMTCWAITQILSIYSCTMSIFSIYLLLSQLDFMLIRLSADSMVNMYTTYRFMKDKRVNPKKYYFLQNASKAMLHLDSDDEDNPPTEHPTGLQQSIKKNKYCRHSNDVHDDTEAMIPALKREMGGLPDFSKIDLSQENEEAASELVVHTIPTADDTSARTETTKIIPNSNAAQVKTHFHHSTARHNGIHNNDPLEHSHHHIHHLPIDQYAKAEQKIQEKAMIENSGLDMLAPLTSLLCQPDVIEMARIHSRTAPAQDLAETGRPESPHRGRPMTRREQANLRDLSPIHRQRSLLCEEMYQQKWDMAKPLRRSCSPTRDSSL